MNLLNGFDTSHYNDAMTATQYGGKDFWIGKVSQGTNFEDPMFQANRNTLMNNAPEVIRGGYHYADYTDPVAEANYFLQLFNPQPGEFTALDVESPTLVGDALVNWCVSFANEVISKTGKAPFFYVDISLQNAYNWTPLITLCGIWLAAPSYTPMQNAPISTMYVMQQIGTAQVNGKAIDQDVFFGTREQLQAYCLPEPTPPVEVVTPPVVTPPIPEPEPPIVTPEPVEPTPPVVSPVNPVTPNPVTVTILPTHWYDSIVDFLSGKKSYAVSGVTILYALVYYGWSKNNWPEAMNFILGGTGMATVRAAIAKLEMRLL